jgi:hypothetical protein
MAADKKGDDDRDLNQYDFPGDVSVRLVRFSEPDPKNPKNQLRYNRVVAVNHKTAKEQVLVPKVGESAFGTMSPNKQYLAISFYTLNRGGDSRLVVINDNGELIANLGRDQI